MRNKALASMLALLVPASIGCSGSTATTDTATSTTESKAVDINKDAAAADSRLPLTPPAGDIAPPPPASLPTAPKVAEVNPVAFGQMGTTVSGRVRNDGNGIAKACSVIISAVDRQGGTVYVTAPVQPADLAPGDLGTFNVKIEGLVADAIVGVDRVQWDSMAADLDAISQYRIEKAKFETRLAEYLRGPEGQMLRNRKMNGMIPEIVASNDASPTSVVVVDPIRTAIAPIERTRSPQGYSRGEADKPRKDKHRKDKHRKDKHDGDKHDHKRASRAAQGSGYVGATSGIPIYDDPSGRAHVIKYLDRPTYSVVRFAGDWNWVMYRDPRNPKDPNVYYGWVRA